MIGVPKDNTTGPACYLSKYFIILYKRKQKKLNPKTIYRVNTSFKFSKTSKVLEKIFSFTGFLVGSVGLEDKKRTGRTTTFGDPCIETYPTEVPSGKTDGPATLDSLFFQSVIYCTAALSDGDSFLRLAILSKISMIFLFVS